MQEAAGPEGLGVQGSREPRHRQAEAVAQVRVEDHAAVRVGDLVHRATEEDQPPVVVAHVVLGLGAPAAQARRQRLLPEDDRQQDEVVRPACRRR